jgi:diaminopimelate decarboxylase
VVSLPVPRRVRSLALRLDRDGELPAYVYDLGALDAHAAAIRRALPRGVEFCYAVKANPDPAVLRTVTPYLDGLEVSSGGELAHAAAAVPGVSLAFGGPGKTAAEITAAVAAGAHRFHVESPHELRLLAATARAAGRTVDVLLRVNLVAGAATSTAQLVMGGPFGMDLDLLGQCADLLDSDSLRLRGLHAHLASGLGAADLLAAAGRLLDFGRGWCAERGVRDPEFNLGGGMGVDYVEPGAVFDWARYGEGLARLALPGETLRIEPGRAVTAYCGWYITRVLDVKYSHGAAFAIVAGGTHHLRTPAAKGHDQPFAVVAVPGWPHSWPRPGIGAGRVTLCGQLCTPKDVLARQVPVRRLRAGDLVSFGLAGAYAWNISHQSFLMHPPPVFHYL